ncbi:fructosyl amine:oxygen oxidoreductase-like protein [Mollisia scopiformis]|uniref:Fructosyl amine:oxygen oxidoreductase-like protein n=1 Tax=Mollisia scopiformis TaxID=149040 RepID=A0A132BCJ3_MOLSC|nr:fructosyl amine:oxygen oxidoreductase-like protein [Mollisia scopiformis]KUJ10135.1 fructosyl amine:oxygen oxidoreductase-like protein [Mollisia scopiformis]
MPTTTPSHDFPILIIGAGTWGCSTALHLARRGYKNITVLDPYPVPSPISAGNDINKIVEQGSLSTSPDSISSTLLHHATHGWTTDPLFTPYYHDTGYIICAHTLDGLAQLTKRESLDNDPDFEWLSSPAEFRATMPEGVLTGEFPGWKGGFKRRGAGWVFARGALVAAYKESERLGVRFVTGENGDVVKLLIEDGDCVGAVTKDGAEWRAETVILAAGASAPQLLDMKDQLRPTAWTLAHIKMSAEECELYKNLPVLFNIESGFFMEPDEEKQELKICDEHPGYCNWVISEDGKRESVPFAKHQIPKEAEDRVRGFLKDTMPQLAGRPFSFARICWCADTPDREFLIDRHPELRSLVLAVGGSGHGFMHITSVGAFIADTVEGKLDPKLKKAFRWRPETAVERNWEDVQGRRGGPNTMTNFGEVNMWTEIAEQGSTTSKL